jgi:probable HAF family extracellular repeat protein
MKNIFPFTGPHPRHALGLLAILCFGLPALTPRQAEVKSTYTLTDLGAGVTPLGINEKGQITGVFGEDRTFRNAKSFLYEAGKMRVLPTSGPFTSLYAHGINKAGVVVGFMVTADEKRTQGFQFDPTRNQTKPIDAFGGKESRAWAVNDAGQIVGHASATPTPKSSMLRDRAFLLEGDKITDIGSLGGENGSAVALKINNQGHIAGNTSRMSSKKGREAFLYKDGKMTSLGTLGGSQSGVEGMNDLDQVVGASDVKGDAITHAFLYKDGKMIDIYPSAHNDVRAVDINNQGQVVGTFGTDAAEEEEHARGFLWKDDQFTDLNRLLPAHPGWLLTNAYAINNKGQIVGVGRFKGRERGFLLTPVSP